MPLHSLTHSTTYFLTDSRYSLTHSLTLLRFSFICYLNEPGWEVSSE